MSIDTLTGDEFATLDLADHQDALDLYDKAISEAAQELTGFEVDYDRFADDRDKLGRLLTLRKVHQRRYDELTEEREAPTTQASFNPEVDQLPQ